MIDRRDFLKIAGAVIPSWGLIPIASAQSPLYTGKILVNVHASGGLDASSWFDPRETDATMNNYAAARTPAVVAGNLRAAPMGSNATFVQRYFQQHAGASTASTARPTATTTALGHTPPACWRWTTRTCSELFAYTQGKSLALPWLNAGGFMTSAGLVPATPMPDGNYVPHADFAERCKALPLTSSSRATSHKMLAARAERVKASRQRATWCRARSWSTRSSTARRTRVRCWQRVNDFLPATFDNAAHVGLVAAQAGLTTTVQFASGGFDGHGQLANSYAQSLPRLTDLVDYIITKAGTMGIANRIFIRIYSEFGRTPLNGGNGKDHSQHRHAGPDGGYASGLGQPGVRRERPAAPADEDRSGHWSGRCRSTAR